MIGIHRLSMVATRTLPAALLAHAVAAQPPAGTPNAEQVKAAYTKREVKITVRDGVALFTSIYVPRDTTRRYPVLM